MTSFMFFIFKDRLLKHKYKRDQIRTTKVTVVSAFPDTWVTQQREVIGLLPWVDHRTWWFILLVLWIPGLCTWRSGCQCRWLQFPPFQVQAVAMLKHMSQGHTHTTLTVSPLTLWTVSKPFDTLLSLPALWLSCTPAGV